MLLKKIRTYIAVSIWVCAVYISAFIPFLVTYLFISRGFDNIIAWSISTVYLFLAIIPLEWTDGSLSRQFIKFASYEGADYFPIRLELDSPESFREGQAYVMGFEPHSSLPLALPPTFALQSNLLPHPLRGNVHGMASSICFQLPLVRQLWWWIGLRPVTRAWMEKLLRQSKSVVLVPGGVQEVLLLEKNKEVLFLKSRKGFIRLAIRNGAPVVPIFAFGQTRTYSWARLGPPIVPQSLVDRLSRLIGAVPIFMYGLYGTPLPHRTPMHVVIGKPIDLGRPSTNPTDEEVEEGLKTYIQAMKDLYERYKVKCGQGDVDLVVV
uniref:Acyltransferase n=1 Tax=Polytomella parva TaxID=51329 RepID=A0A7S0VKA2_9CHLO|mmetsp:Transcript_7933/g.15438  ORF Transcript_7933/g.15438 Transcript_7933/m.15438 type:complete len:322 (+) Transcript_7933:362-1327(+)